ncbi:MAG: hypothetical protein ACOYXB_12070 [Bacteroidota bacterium]
MKGIRTGTIILALLMIPVLGSAVRSCATSRSAQSYMIQDRAELSRNKKYKKSKAFKKSVARKKSYAKKSKR